MSTTDKRVDVVLPQLTEGMEEATLLAWLASDGAVVAAGDPLVEIESDKATVVHAAEAYGILRIVVSEGESVRVGTVIARIESGSPSDGGAGTPPSVTAPATPAPSEAAGVPSLPAANGIVPQALLVSPLARRLAARHSVDLSTVTGYGPGGMILRSDVLRAADRPADEARILIAPSAPPAAGRRGEVVVVRPSRVQRIVAERMVLSHSTVPVFTMRVDVDMERAAALRAELKAAAGEEPAPSYNDMVVKAAGLALRRMPRANAALRDEVLEQYSRVNVGVAVAVPDGLLVPVVADADRLSLGGIARESRRLAAAVRDGSLAPEDLEGGTFTVSNLGMYGLRSFTAVINPPQAAILAVGAVRPEPVVRDGEIRASLSMSMTLSGDHRVLNGVDGAKLLIAIAKGLEDPLRLALS